MKSNNKAALARAFRHQRIRKKVNGTTERPRLCVSRSLKHISAQLIDDVKGHTLASASSLSADVKKSSTKCGTLAAAKLVGEILAGKATAAGIKNVVFDRGGYSYHGQVKALADAAREKGLAF